jgi:alkanesulfonate monooxygenase SsuD/methylene tetrahydromethanopterin reductase-like flavin-dependent oxidoreductase (luciferase family)
MPDYGHPLRFATFISPANSPAHRPVELAQLSERLGFDFVTFQDHPYKADFLDTWTLLSWVAARTERIGLSGNVLNLPLRQPPAVLARATASLDLLSGGRTSLGLGAGFFWDAVQAIGGRRLTPMQGVTALGEAIDVIRGIWEADGPGTLNVEGEFYKVHGAERGPARRGTPGGRTRRMVRQQAAAQEERERKEAAIRREWEAALAEARPRAVDAVQERMLIAALRAWRDARDVREICGILTRGADEADNAGETCRARNILAWRDGGLELADRTPARSVRGKCRRATMPSVPSVYGEVSG